MSCRPISANARRIFRSIRVCYLCKLESPVASAAERDNVPTRYSGGPAHRLAVRDVKFDSLPSSYSVAQLGMFSSVACDGRKGRSEARR